MSEYRNIILFFPVIAGYMMESLCPIDIKFNNVDNMSIIFSSIWTIMYTIIGYTWKYEQSKKINKIYVLITALSMLWVYYFSCLNDFQMSIYILLLIIGSTYMLIFKIKSKKNKLLLSLYLFILHIIFILIYKYNNI